MDETETRDLAHCVLLRWNICSHSVSGAKTRFSSVLPILTPDYVTDKIIEAMLQNQEMIVMPRFLYLVLVAKTLLPFKATIACMDFFGGADLMASFTGRQSSS